jgi:hypothetical protein
MADMAHAFFIEDKLDALSKVDPAGSGPRLTTCSYTEQKSSEQLGPVTRLILKSLLAQSQSHLLSGLA